MLSEADRQRFPHLSPGDYVKIMVGDTGCGIAPDVLAKVYEPLGIGEGTGLGLSVVYGFIRQTGGQVAIDSVPGEGTNVALYLPRAAAARPTTTSKADVPSRLKGTESILVVEDEEAVRRFPVFVLAQNGYRVQAVANGQTALAELDGDRTYDLVFTDLVLPGGMTGLDVAIAARQRYPDIKVLFTTGNSSNFAGARLPEPLLRKPYDSETLLREIRRALEAPPLTASETANR